MPEPDTAILRVPRDRPMTVWRALALQESTALRLLLRAHGRLPQAAPLRLPFLTQRDARLILAGRRLLEAVDPNDPVLAACGTSAAYRRHRRRGEACVECRDAHATTKRTRARERRQASDTAASHR